MKAKIQNASKRKVNNQWYKHNNKFVSVKIQQSTQQQIYKVYSSKVERLIAPVRSRELTIITPPLR